MAPGLTELARRLVVEAGVAPAAAVAVAYRKGRSWCVESGAAERDAPPNHATPTDLRFDLASVSKPFVAAALVRLAHGGLLSLSCPLVALLPCVQGAARAQCSLERLLSHRSGLTAHVPLYAALTSGRAFDRQRALRAAADAVRAECRGADERSEQPPLYSDLGYVLAGAAAENTLATPLDALVFEQVLEPLGLDVGSARQCARRDPEFFARVVPTEIVPRRGGDLRGVVHDDNAWAFAGHGVAGQAGLFGTAAGVARFGAAMLDALAGRDDRWLDRASAAFLCQARPGGTLRAGFDGKAPTGASAGERAGPHTFGHLGFTGTSVWCDPDRDTATVLLTNRVRFGPDRARIRAARPRVHDALFSWADARM